MDDATAAAVEAFARGGGHVLVTYLSGVADTDDHIRLGGYPGAFTGMIGAVTEEFFPLGPDDTVRLDDGSTAGVWTELTSLRGATAHRTFADGPVAGSPAVTRHAVGDGVVWYLGTRPDDAGLAALMAEVADGAGVRPVVAGLEAVAAQPVPGWAKGGLGPVEVVRRSGPQGSFLFVLNHSASDAQVPCAGTDLVGGTAVDGSLLVPAGGCAVVAEHAADRPADRTGRSG